MLIYVYYETKISLKEKKINAESSFLYISSCCLLNLVYLFHQFDKIVCCRIPKIIYIIERINVINRISFLYNLVSLLVLLAQPLSIL